MPGSWAVLLLFQLNRYQTREALTDGQWFLLEARQGDRRVLQACSMADASKSRKTDRDYHDIIDMRTVLVRQGQLWEIVAD
jgi:hypothetical protein